MLDRWDLIHEAEKKAYPVMRDEARRLGVPVPAIEWCGYIIVAGEKIVGVYGYDSQKIHLSSRAVDIIIEERMPRDRTVFNIMMAIFHEFKHYIDDKVYGVSIDDFRADREKYEEEATSFAEKMMIRFVVGLSAEESRKMLKRYYGKR